MSDIVEMLRAVDHMSVEDCFLQSPLFAKAADEIARLRADLERAREVLRDITDACVAYLPDQGWMSDDISQYVETAAVVLKEIE